MNKKFNAFSLAELLVVLAIIGILVMIALPNFHGVVNKARSTEAKLQLKFLYDLQQTYFLEESSYSDRLEDLGFEQENLVTEDGDAIYVISINSADNSGFSARATAVKDFDGDGKFNVWEINEKKELVETLKD